jgi:hypothetical protein
MSRLTFDLAAVRELMAHAKAAPQHRPTFDDETTDRNTEPAALMLVGDTGIYLASNGVPHLPREDGTEGMKVVYATECNPDTNEDWYDAKIALFGGDDGVDDIPIADLDRMLRSWGEGPWDTFVIEMSEDEFSMSLE